MYEIAILDTSNFIDFPIGGQSASIRNFLKFCNDIKDKLKDIILIGISTDVNQRLGEVIEISIEGIKVDFLPISYINSDEDNLSSSLRALYLRGLIKYRKNIRKLNVKKFYIQSVEAIGGCVMISPRKPRIFFSHGNILDTIDYLKFGGKGKINKMVIELFYIFSLVLSNKIFILDEKTRGEYSKYKDISRMFIVKNSIDIDKYRHFDREKNKVKRLLYVGRLSENKGIDKIILSLTYLKNSNYILNIVGAGEQKEYLKEVIEKNDLDENVKLLGKKIGDELIDIYLGSDILIMNSKTEGTPMVILEALSSGIPVVTTAVGNIPNIIKSGYNGEFSDSTPKDIGDKIIKLINNLDIYKENALESSKKYSYKEVNDEIYNILFEGE